MPNSDRTATIPDPPRRRGRPRADQAGEVEARVLDVASQLFLSQGFERTSFEAIAELAHAGKATLYARYGNKETLFKAVVGRKVALALERIQAGSPARDRRQRLLVTGACLAEEILVPDVIALMRITIAEATRFPEMALASYRIGFGGSVNSVAEAIAGHDQTSEQVARAVPAATRFVERVMLPLQLHALYGVDLESLRIRAKEDIARAVDELLAGSDERIDAHGGRSLGQA